MSPLRPLRLILGLLLLSLVAVSYHWQSISQLKARGIASKAVDNLQHAIPGLSSYLSKPADPYPQDDPTLVPLEAHIMSKCPDARICLNRLVVPTMVKVSEKVNFRLSFIGRPTEADGGVECKHGPTECLGNILILCAAKVYPSPKQYLGFANCLIDRFTEIPQRALVHDCALEYSMSFDKLNECASANDGGDGMDMLRASVERSNEVGASLSCTVRLDGKEWCIVDGGRWKQCDSGHEPVDLENAIEALYKERNSEQTEQAKT